MILKESDSKPLTKKFDRGLFQEVDLILSGPRLVPNWRRIRVLAVVAILMLMVTIYGIVFGHYWLEKISLTGAVATAASIVAYHQLDSLKSSVAAHKNDFRDRSDGCE